MSLRDDVILIAGFGVAAFVLYKQAAPSISSGVDAAIEVAKAAGGNSGVAVFDWLHFTSPTDDMRQALPDSVAASYDGNIYNQAGDLIGWESDDYWIRDPQGRRLWQSSWSGTRYGLVFHLAKMP